MSSMSTLLGLMPYARFLGVIEKDSVFQMPFQEHLIGNPILPAIHGGAIAGFAEICGLVTLSFQNNLMKKLPKTIDFSTDYMRPGKPIDTYAKANIWRSGKRYASVLIQIWQEDPTTPIAVSHAHFLVAQDETE